MYCTPQYVLHATVCTARHSMYCTPQLCTARHSMYCTPQYVLHPLHAVSSRVFPTERSLATVVQRYKVLRPPTTHVHVQRSLATVVQSYMYSSTEIPWSEDGRKISLPIEASHDHTTTTHVRFQLAPDLLERSQYMQDGHTQTAPMCRHAHLR